MAVLAVSAASTLSLYTAVSWNVEAGRHVFGDETTVRPEKKVYAVEIRGGSERERGGGRAIAFARANAC